MSIMSSLGVGTNGEMYYWWQNRRLVTGSDRAILWHHGAGGETQMFDPIFGQTALVGVISTVVEAGFTVLSCDFGGAQTWANAANQARIDDAVSFLPTLGCRNDKVALWGISMGFSCIARWAAANASKVAAIEGTIPAADTQWVWDNNAGLHTAMDAAFAPSTWAANKAATDPSSSTIATALTALPVRLDYNSDDTTVGATTATALATLLGMNASAHVMGTGGHVLTTMTAIDQPAFVRHFEDGNW